MKILAIDYGKSKIGLAVNYGKMADPLSVIKVSGRKEAVKKIKKISQTEKVDKFLVGLPDGCLAEEIKQFADQLAKETGIQVLFGDETLTSQQAVKKMIEAGKPLYKRRQQEDAVSACLILQNYLETNS